MTDIGLMFEAAIFRNRIESRFKGKAHKYVRTFITSNNISRILPFE